MQTRVNVDLDDKYAVMLQRLKDEYGVSYSAELVRVLIKAAYDRVKGPYSLEKSYVQPVH